MTETWESADGPLGTYPIGGIPMHHGAGAVPPSTHGDVLKAACALFTPEQLAEVVAHRVIIEQAKGMLMMAYGIDAVSAFGVLSRQSQRANVMLRVIAERLCGELLELAQGEHVDLRSACDAAVNTVHERVVPANGESARSEAVATDRVSADSQVRCR